MAIETFIAGPAGSYAAIGAMAVATYLCRASGVQCIAVGGIVEPAAAEELERRGCETHKQGDMERAGRELASRSSSPPS